MLLYTMTQPDARRNSGKSRNRETAFFARKRPRKAIFPPLAPESFCVVRQLDIPSHEGNSSAAGQKPVSPGQFWSAAIHRRFSPGTAALCGSCVRFMESGDESPHSKKASWKAAMNRRTPKRRTDSQTVFYPAGAFGARILNSACGMTYAILPTAKNRS